MRIYCHFFPDWHHEESFHICCASHHQVAFSSQLANLRVHTIGMLATCSEGNLIAAGIPLVKARTLIGMARVAVFVNGASRDLELNLSNKQIGNGETAALAETLKLKGSLTSLELGCNQIGDMGAAALADALKINGSLTSLKLASNQRRQGCHRLG